MEQVNAPGVRWEWISEAWNLFTKQWSVWVQMLLVMFGVVIVAYLPMGLLSLILPDEPMAIFSILSLLFSLLFVAVVVGGMFCMAGGLYHAAFKQIRGEEISVRDLLAGRQYFLQILAAAVLLSIGVSIGSLLCVIPGLIVSGLCFLTFPMIVEGGKGPIDAIKASIEVTKKDWLMFTLFSLALGFVAEAGAIACGIGLLATAPLAFLGQALAYRDLVGISGAPAQRQFTSPPPPDYRSYTPSQTPAASSDYGYHTPSQTPAAQPDYNPYTPSPSPPPPTPPQPPSWEAQTVVTPAVSETPAMTCPHCGAALARVVNFCNQCGRSLRGA
ncbi:MAG TPA: zinc-ribbon domain-containing protein [Blastocatellia bacterium]